MGFPSIVGSDYYDSPSYIEHNLFFMRFRTWGDVFEEKQPITMLCSEFSNNAGGAATRESGAPGCCRDNYYLPVILYE